MVGYAIRAVERAAEWVLAWVVQSIPRWVKPNHVTGLRIVLVPPIAVLSGYGENFLATVLLALAVASDAIDGALARARGEKSKLGEVLDPFADKLLILTVLLVDWLFHGWSHLPPEFVLLAVALEIALVIGRLIKWWRGKSNGANDWGKVKMQFQSASVIGLVIGVGWTIAAANLYLGVAVLAAVGSFVGHTGYARNLFG